MSKESKKIAELEEKVAALEFDLEWQALAAQKRQQVAAVNQQAMPVNKFLAEKPIDTKNDAVKDIVRKVVYRNIGEQEGTRLLTEAYRLKEDRSKSQKESKKEDIGTYGGNRFHKILGDILKEDFAVQKFGKALKPKEYCERHK